MATIDYEKYANMSRRQLLNSLIKAEKKEQKIRLEFESKIQNTRELVKFLKTKIKESLDKPKYEFIPYEESESFKGFQESFNRMDKAEQEQLKSEVNELIRGYDEL